MNRTAIEQLDRLAKADLATHEAAEKAEAADNAVTVTQQAADAAVLAAEQVADAAADARDIAFRHYSIVEAETVAAFNGRYFADSSGVIYTATNGKLVKILPEPASTDVSIPLVDIDGDGKFDNETFEVIVTPAEPPQ